MLESDAKRLAYATMDDAASFSLCVAAHAPVGEQVVEVARGRTMDDVRPAARLIRKMAKTFFGDKFTGSSDDVPEGAASVSLYVVAELAELDAANLSGLSDEGEPPRT